MIRFAVRLNLRWFLRPLCHRGHDWQYVGMLHPLLGGNFNYCKRCGWGWREVVAMAEYLIRRQRERSGMASNWTKHLMTRHGTTERELSELARDAVRLTVFHDFHHVEFAAQLDHTHDEYGQIHESKVLS